MQYLVQCTMLFFKPYTYNSYSILFTDAKAMFDKDEEEFNKENMIEPVSDNLQDVFETLIDYRSISTVGAIFIISSRVYFAMCSHGSGNFSDMSHMIIGQIYYFVERKT